MKALMSSEQGPPSDPVNLPMLPSPNNITLVVQISTCEFQEHINIQSITLASESDNSKYETRNTISL
jgi:hypothetical protein